MLVKLEIFPKLGLKINRYLSCHHLDNFHPPRLCRVFFHVDADTWSIEFCGARPVFEKCKLRSLTLRKQNLQKKTCIWNLNCVSIRCIRETYITFSMKHKFNIKYSKNAGISHSCFQHEGHVHRHHWDALQNLPMEQHLKPNIYLKLDVRQSARVYLICLVYNLLWVNANFKERPSSSVEKRTFSMFLSILVGSQYWIYDLIVSFISKNEVVSTVCFFLDYDHNNLIHGKIWRIWQEIGMQGSHMFTQPKTGAKKTRI